jgi:hypothetical protein
MNAFLSVIGIIFNEIINLILHGAVDKVEKRVGHVTPASLAEKFKKPKGDH